MSICGEETGDWEEIQNGSLKILVCRRKFLIETIRSTMSSFFVSCPFSFCVSLLCRRENWNFYWNLNFFFKKGGWICWKQWQQGMKKENGDWSVDGVRGWLEKRIMAGKEVWWRRRRKLFFILFFFYKINYCIILIFFLM